MATRSPMTTRRKLSIATWAPPNEGNIYGKLVIDASKLDAAISRLREATGEKITVTHLVGKAVAMGLAACPGLNGRIRLGTYIPHDTVDVTFLVNLEGGQDLAKAKVPETDKKSLAEIARALQQKALALRGGKDPDFEKTKGVLRILPTWILRPLVWFTGFLGGSLGWNVAPLGVEAFPFGSCIITSVGMFGIDEGYAPHTPFARVPLLLVVGAIRNAVVADGDQAVVRPQLTLTATIDHRFIDGFQIARLAGIVRDLLENPEKLEA